MLPSSLFYILVSLHILFCSCVIGFLSCFFLYSPHTRRRFGLWTYVWSQRRSRGVQCTLSRNLDPNFCPAQGFEPRTSHLAVQHATTSPPCTPVKFHISLIIH